jgi:glyoxylase-like metal-dependent hydrolase (beta-lactamase superfamily II)
MLSGKGGSLAGGIAAVEKLIASTDASTKIIPGHGPLANRADLVAYLDMLRFANTSLSDMKASGMAVNAVIALKPMAQYDAKWGQGLFSADKWIGLIYGSLD